MTHGSEHSKRSSTKAKSIQRRAGKQQHIHRQYEEALRQSEIRYRSLFETMPDGFASVDMDGRIVEANRAFRAMFGYAHDEMFTPTFKDLSPEEWHALEGCIIRKQVMTRGYSDPYEKECIRKDGAIFHAEVRLHLAADGALPRQMWAFVRDVSKRKHAEMALQESEEKFRLLFEKSGDPVALIDGDTAIDCNEAMMKLMGSPTKDRLLWQPPEVFTPERQPDGSLSSERARENNAAAIEKGVNYFEWVIRTLDGRELWVEVDQTVIPIRGRQVFYTILRDIEERKRSEEALKESEERYRRVVELSPCGIVIHVAGKIEFANRSFADMVAAPRPEQLYGKNALDFCHPDFTELAAARITMIEAGEPQVPLVEQKLVRLDGSVIDVELTAFHFSLKGRNAVMVATKDITERKRAEENLLTRESELETRSFELAETNTALNVLLRRREEDKVALENAIQANVKEVVFPYIEKLRSTHLSGTQGSYVNIIESSLNEIISPFLHKMAARYAGLTRSEIQVANMIKGGKSSKEIANALNVSIGTVETHRNSIRKKLGLRHKNGNLQAHLLSL